ncbi:MAG: hypothetical protein ACJA2E_002694, partial [Arenicella sp.]
MTMIKILEVSVAEQMMRGYSDAEQIIFEVKIATAKNGYGQLNGSECTPLGEHRIRAKIGAQQRENTVYIGRRPSGEIYTPALALQYPDR